MSKEKSIKRGKGNAVSLLSSNSKELEKPTPEKYGWHEQQGFDDEPSGWIFEGGEEAYYEALKEWEAQQ